MTCRSSQAGFTLIEAVMGMMILASVSISAIVFVEPVLEMAVQKQFSNGIAYEGHLAVMKMTRDISQLRDNQSVDIAETAQLQFDDVNDQSIAFTVSGGTLFRNGIKMTEGVTQLQFSYFDIDNEILAEPDLAPVTNIHRIEVMLTVGLAGNSRTWRVQVKPRNLAV